MKAFRNFLILVSGLGIVMPARASLSNWAYAEGWFINSERTITNVNEIDTTTNGTSVPNLDSRSVAIWSGGNLDFVADAPTAVFVTSSGLASASLVQSAIGQMVAGPLGYAGASSNLIASAQTAIDSGAAYRYHLLPGTSQPIGLQGGAFNIIFPGVPTTFGTNGIVEGDPTINYFPDQLRNAEAAARAALRLNPNDTNAAHLLVQTFAERLYPLTFAGNSALVLASRSRLTGQNPALAEINNYAIAISFFNQAADVFRELAGYSSDALLVEGQNPDIGQALTEDVSSLLDGFLRAAGQRADALFQYELRRYQTDYRDPTRPFYSINTNLLNDIDSAGATLRGDLLLASQFNFLPAFNFAEGSRVVTLLNDLASLRASITQARLIFVAGSSGTGSETPDQRYAEYTTDYVPFFAPDPNNPNQNNFERALGLANLFVNDSKNQDGLAEAAIEKIAINDYQNQTAQNDIQVKYESELLDLCGSASNDSNGSPVPDIFFAALSPGQREQMAGGLLTNGYALSANNTGLIYQQWNAVEQATTELNSAQLGLSNIFSEMQNRQDIETQISGGQRQIANLINADGEKVVALDQEAGEIQAQLAIAIGDIQAQAAEKQANNSMIGGIISASPGLITSAISGNYAGLLAAGAQAGGGIYTAMQNAYASAEAARAAGQASAAANRRLADIQAQKDRISALERSQIQFESANETDLRLAEALHSLVLQAEQQRLTILLAMQKLDQENAKLASLFQRVSYLLSAYRRAIILQNQNPQDSPDYRLDRDAIVLRAEDAFVLAQQWSFVAAQAFAYRDNRPLPDTANYIASVLAARNGQQLGAVLNLLTSANGKLDLSYQSSPYATKITVSIRNDLLQNNVLTNDQVFTSNGVLDLARAYSYEPTAGGTTFQASDDAWLQFLQTHVSHNEDGSISLGIPFGLGLENLFQDLFQRNPLFDRTVFGRVIQTDLGAGGNKGVRINFVLRGVPTGGTFQGGANPAVVAGLSQEGLALVRRSAWKCDSDRTGLRVFNDIPRFSGKVDAAINNIEALPGTEAFKERSPANTKWVIEINNFDSFNNGLLLNNLALLKDIQLQFFVRGFQDQNCQ
jgi:hypothetical protein